jgi:chromosome segregation ATPase
MKRFRKHLRTLALAAVGLCSLVVPASAQQGSGFTYRIGECNPYDDNAWLKTYNSVQSGSEMDKLYNSMRARFAQSQQDSAYLDKVRRQYDADRARWTELNDDYTDELRDYKEDLRAYNKEASVKILHYKFGDPNDNDAGKPVTVEKSPRQLAREKDLRAWKRDLDDWSGDLDEKNEKIQQMRQDLNNVFRQIDNYSRKAEQNSQEVQRLSSTYQSLRNRTIRRQDNRRHAG